MLLKSCYIHSVSLRTYIYYTTLRSTLKNLNFKRVLNENVCLKLKLNALRTIELVWGMKSTQYHLFYAYDRV